MSTKAWHGIEGLEARFGKMTVGMFIRSFREADEISQVVFAKKLRFSRANLCDIEKGRKLISPERAALIAKKLDVPEQVLVQLAIQDLLRNAHLNYSVTLEKVA